MKGSTSMNRLFNYFVNFKKKNQITSNTRVTKSQKLNPIDSFSSKIKEFFRKFWLFFVAFGGVVAYFIVNRKKPIDNLPDDIRNSGKQFADDVDVVRRNEQQSLAHEAELHKEKTEAIKKKYEAEKEKLDEETKDKAEKLFESYKNDPKALAEELSKVTGFRVILPED